MKKISLFFTSLASVGLLSCTDSKLPKYVELNSLRVLALIADKPEVNPGETVTITPLISDINETTSLTFEAIGCVDPGISLGAEPSCKSNPTKTTLDQGTITSTSTNDMAQNFTGATTAFSAVIPMDAIIFNQRSEQDKFNGIGYVIEYTLTNSRGDSVTTIKRILISQKTNIEKNINPVVTELQSNGSAIGTTDFPVNGKFRINMVFDPSSFQTYTLRKADGTNESLIEELTTTWFITDGELKYFRSTNQDANEYTAPVDTVVTSRKRFLISVSRDSRGGATYKRICGGGC